MVAHSRINRHISSQVSVDKGQEEDGSQQQLLGSVPDNTWQKRETKVEPKKTRVPKYKDFVSKWDVPVVVHMHCIFDKQSHQQGFL